MNVERDVRDVPVRARRVASVSGALLAVCVSALAACGPKPPPPHVVEVPLDQFNSGGPAPAPVDGTPRVAEVPVETVSGTATASTGARPAPLPTPAPQSTATLTGPECTQLLNKGAVLYGVSHGMSTAKATKGVANLRRTAQADPSYAMIATSCTTQHTKPQLECAMKTSSLDAWKGCLE